MSESDTSIVLAPNELGRLAADIRCAYAGFEASWNDALTRAIALGTTLLKAKSQIRHGGWLPFLDECQVTSQAASTFMRVAQAAETGELDRIPDTGRNMSLRRAAAFVTTNRRRGEVPDKSLTARISSSAIGYLLGKSSDQRKGAAIANYLQRLLDAMVEDWDSSQWTDDADTAAHLVIVAVGVEKAAELGRELSEQAMFFGRLGQVLRAAEGR